MVAHADRILAVAGRIAALSLAALCGACGAVSDPAGLSIATQDHYDFMDCREIVKSYYDLTAREKTLTSLAARAETSPGGIIVSYSAYRSELTQTRALIAAVNRAVQRNNCDLSKRELPKSEQPTKK